MADQTVIRSSDLIITGNLQVSGSQITTDQNDLTVKDRLITLNKEGTLTGTDKSGIEIESGGTIIATLGYTTNGSGGWDFGGANIINAGSISTSLTGLSDTPSNYTGSAGQYLKVNSGETAIEFDALTTDDVTEGTNLYYTTGRFDTAFSGKTTTDLSEGTNLYYTTGRFNTAFSGKTTTDLSEGTNLYYTDGRFDTRLAAKTTTDLTEGSNLYYTTARANTDIDARLATTSINILDDVDTSGVSSGQVLMWNGADFVPQGAPLGVTENQVAITSSTGAISVANSSFDTSSSTATRIGNSVTLTVEQNATVLVSFNAGLVSQNTGSDTALAIQKSINGGTSFTSLVEFASNSTGFPLNFTYFDNHATATSSVEYRVVVRSGTPTITYSVSNINFSATEFKVGEFGSLNDLSDATITSESSGQILKYNGSQWVNETPTISVNSDVAVTSPSTGQVLRYNGSQFENTDLTAFSIGGFGDVDTTTASTGKILRYDGSSWNDSDLTPFSIAEFGDVNIGTPSNGAVLKYNTSTSQWEAGVDIDTDTGILSIVEDTSPQLGGNLDVQTNSIVSTGANNIVLEPQGTGIVQINGDLTVTGTATTLEVTNVEVEDAIMLLNKHSTQPANNTNDGGIMVQRGTAEDNAAWYWDETDDRWVAATTTNTAADVDLSATANADIQAATAYLTATQAQYADLAEIYKSDADYEPGTVVVFGGEHEVTHCNRLLDHRVAGVVSTAPAYLMNKDAEGIAVALRGKVPCKVEGPVRKGDLLVTNVTPGTATTLTDDSPAPAGYCVIGKSLEDNSNTGIKLVNIVV